jgi:hypothetical protein
MGGRSPIRTRLEEPNGRGSRSLVRRLFPISEGFPARRRSTSSPMATGEQNGLDSWLIGDLRRHARPLRTDGLLLDDDVSKLACRMDTAERELADLRTRVTRTERRLEGVSVHHAAAHTRFVPAAVGYEVVETDGPPPRAGDEVMVDERRLRVLRVGRSPFPFDRRPCAYLVAA